MKILSWNVRGLGGLHWKRKRSGLRQEISKELTNGELDFLFLQEHHLKVAQTSNYGAILNGDWDVSWSKGYDPTENQGGVCVAVRGSWRNHVISKIEIVPGRALLIQIEK